MTKTYTLQQWTHGDIYTMRAIFTTFVHSDPNHLQHLQKAAVAFVYHHNNIYPTAVIMTLIKNSGSIYTQ